MFENLSAKLGDIFGKLTNRGALSPDMVHEALREVRVALLEADVALPVVKNFIASVETRAVGQEVLRSITPGQQVIKIVNDHLIELLGTANEGLDLNAPAPVSILMVGLQGAGKTTATAKLARHLTQKENKKVLMVSLDTRRPAAQEQLRILGEQTKIVTLPIIPNQSVIDISKRGLEEARLGGFDVVFFDTAGRLSIDDELMQEVAQTRDVVKPTETILVADAMTGQDAVQLAENFNNRVGITSIMLTRIDGDARGGAALSMRMITGKPIKWLGVGEKIDALEAFHPDRIASRILGMGDVVSLVEKAKEQFDEAETEKLAKKVQKGQFDMDDLLSQLRQMKKMGGLSGIMNLMPGALKMKKEMSGMNVDDAQLKKQEAIILSMTRNERRDVRLLNGSRRRRIAQGSGTTVPDVNRLIKQFQDMQSMMKRVQKLGKSGMLRQGLQGLMP